MAIEVFRLKRLRVYEEPSGSFATDNIGNLSTDFLDVPFIEGTLTLNPEIQSKELNLGTQELYADSGLIQDRQRPTLSFNMYCHPTGAAAGDGVASKGATDLAEFAILKAVLGGIDSGNDGSTLQAVNSQSDFDVDTGDGSNWSQHSGIVLLDSSSRAQLLEVQAVSTDNITTRTTGPLTVANGTEAYNPTTFYLDDSDTSLQWVIEGAGARDRWQIFGSQATSASLEMVSEEFWVWSFTFTGVHFKNLGTGTLATADNPNFAPVFDTGPFIAATSNTTSGTAHDAICTTSRTLTLNIQYQEVYCPNATYGAERWKAVPQRPFAEMSFDTYYDDETASATEWYDAAVAGSKHYFSQQLGNAISTTEGVVGLVAGNAQVYQWEPIEIEGLSGQKVTARILRDVTPSAESAKINSPIRLHIT